MNITGSSTATSISSSASHGKRLVWLAAAIIIAVLVADQALKIWVKTHFYLGEEVRIFSWFRLMFVENNGMAFGMEIGSKLLLTVLRILLVVALLWYIRAIGVIRGVKRGYIVCLALIVAGALGNIIDCVFYGEIFNDPFPPRVAELFPAGGGYGTWLHGKVVDMLYFPLFSFDWPMWMPIVGGDHFIFFQPVFNLADSAITIGVLSLILFYSKEIASPSQLRKAAASQSESAEQ